MVEDKTKRKYLVNRTTRGLASESQSSKLGENRTDVGGYIQRACLYRLTPLAARNREKERREILRYFAYLCDFRAARLPPQSNIATLRARASSRTLNGYVSRL